MSVDYYVACHECRKIVHIAQDGMSGFHFYSREPGCMKALSKLLETCLMEHRERLAFVKEQSPEWDAYEAIEWPNRAALPRVRVRASTFSGDQGFDLTQDGDFYMDRKY